MLSYGSHISAIVLFMSFVCACTKSNEKVNTQINNKVALVSSEEYRSGSCWTHKDGSFVAFLAFGKENNQEVPYLISTNCLVTGNHTSYGEAILLHFHTIRMTDKHGQLQSRFPELDITDNLSNHQKFPLPDSNVYYFKAHLKKVSFSSFAVYSPYIIESVSNINISFERFLGLSHEDREALLESLNR